MEDEVRRKHYFLPMVLIGIMFFIIGFGVGISGFLTPFLQSAFNLSLAQSYLVTVAIFSAFALFAAPAGWIIRKVGYKKAMILAFFIMAIGMFLFVPASNYLSFPLFLFALVIGGIGNTLLQAAVNPYVIILGPLESAAMRISLMSILNKSAWWLGSLFLGLFMNLKNVQLNDIVFPFYIVTGILLSLGLFLIYSPLPEVKAIGEDEDDTDSHSTYSSNKTSVFQFPHLLLGVVALFLYVGVETLPMVSIIGYANAIFGNSMDDPDSFLMIMPLGLVLGYLFGVLVIPKLISQTNVLILFSILGIVSALLLIYLSDENSIYTMALIGFSNSLMWPAIWPLSISDLGRFTKSGSALLVMGMVGGAVIPLVFGVIIDAVKTTEIATAVDYQKGYWLFIPAYVYILCFAIKGNRIR